MQTIHFLLVHSPGYWFLFQFKICLIGSITEHTHTKRSENQIHIKFCYNLVTHWQVYMHQKGWNHTDFLNHEIHMSLFWSHHLHLYIEPMAVLIEEYHDSFLHLVANSIPGGCIKIVHKKTKLAINMSITIVIRNYFISKVFSCF